MKHLRNVSISFTAVYLAASLALPAFAQTQPVTTQISNGLKGAGAASGYAQGTTDLPTIIGRLISAALGLLGVVLLAYVLYGGYLWMTAQGDSKKVDTARDTIKNAIIGLVIIVAAYAITGFVIQQLSGVLTGSSTVTVTGA